MVKTASATLSENKDSQEQEIRIAHLERLSKITHLIHSAGNVDEILIHLRDSIVTLFDAERVTIYAVDGKIRQEIYSRVKVGNIPHTIRLPVNRESIAGYVASTGLSVSINDAYNDNELKAIYPDLKFDRSWDLKTGFRTKQLLTQPLMHKRYLVGVIQIINKKSGNYFTPRDSSSLQEIVEVLGLAFYKHIIQDTRKYSDKTVPEGNETEEVLADIGLEDESIAENEFEEEKTDVNEYDSCIVDLVNEIILNASNESASDIHIETYPGKQNTVIRFRQDGTCRVHKEIPAKWKRALVARIKSISNLNRAENRLSLNGKIQIRIANKKINLGVTTVPTYGGNEDVIMRLLATRESLPLDKLGLSQGNMEYFADILQQRYGIFLVVGPPGSGKTTTLHSALSHVNTPERKIWTAEYPIEIVQQGLRQVQMKPDIKLNFATALRMFLQADSDIIMIGEMDDQEIAKQCIETSLNGHLVLSTLNTHSALETITRLIDFEIDPFNLADALLGILAQRLIYALCPHCKVKYTPSRKELDSLAKEYNEELWPELKASVDSVNMHKPEGCDKCNNTGFRGRIGVHEILVISPETKRLIQKNAPAGEIRDSAIRHGMRTLKQDGILKVLKGDTNIEKVRYV